MKKIYKTPYLERFDFNQNDDVLTSSPIGSENWYNDSEQFGQDNFN